MRLDLNDIQQLMIYYLTRDENNLPTSTRRKAKDLLVRCDLEFAGSIVDELVSFFQKKNNEFKRKEFFFLSNLMRRQRNESIEKRRIILKTALQRKLKQKDWKMILLSPCLIKNINVFFKSIKYDASGQTPIIFNRDRFRMFKGEGALSTNAVLGSNFVTTVQKFIHKDESHIVDAVGSSHFQQGDIFIGVADGCGGHLRMTIDDFKNPRFKTEEQQQQALECENRGLVYQDQQIARAAHFAIKHTFRLFGSFDKPDELKRKMNSVVEMVKCEVELKAGTERTTLACIRAYPMGNQYRLIGFHIGDSYIGAYHREKKIFKTVAPAIVTLVSEHQEATAQMPGYNDFEIHHVDLALEAGYILFAMSDGYTDFLPVCKERKAYQNGLQYNEVSLNNAAIQQLFDKMPGKDFCFESIKLLTREVINETNTARKEHLKKSSAEKQDMVIGDDMAIISVQLPEGMPVVSTKTVTTATKKFR